MDYITTSRYAENVLARCSTDFHGHLIDAEDFEDVLTNFIEWGHRLDRIKKALFYGKPFQFELNTDNLPVITPMEPGDPCGNQMTHAILGIASESVELCEALLAGFNNPTSVDEVNLREEFGDVRWYYTLGLDAIGSNDEECRTINDNKLEKRYGPAFSSDRANSRDLDAERKELER